MTTIVHLLRHGEVHNPQRILYGRLPGYRLSELGRQQAKTVAKVLADHDISHVVSSPLERARETALPTVDALNATRSPAEQLELHTDDALIEADNLFEGMRIATGDGALWRPEHWSKLRNPFKPSWGEPYSEIAHRMLGAVRRARESAEGREALCVSHQLPIWTLRRFLEGRRLWHDPRRRQCALASLTSLIFSQDELVEIVYSEPAGSGNSQVGGA
jgi:broad specificity phosphatase PhoE